MTPEEIAKVKTTSLVTAAGWALPDVAFSVRNTADDVAVRDFQLPDNPCSCLLFKTSKAAGVIEVKKFGATFRGITEESHRYTVQLPQHLAHCRTHLALQREYSAAALNSTQAKTAPLSATLEHVFGIDAMGAHQ